MTGRTINSTLSLLVLLALLLAPAEAALAGELKVCNRGDVTLEYAKIHRYQDSLILSSMTPVLAGSCSVLVRSLVPATFAFFVRDIERGVVYNPVYEAPGDVESDSESVIKSFCLPAPTGNIEVELPEQEARESYIDNCPEGWVRIKSSFTVLHMGSGQNYTLEANPIGEDFDGRAAAFSMRVPGQQTFTLSAPLISMQYFRGLKSQRELTVSSNGRQFDMEAILASFQFRNRQDFSSIEKMQSGIRFLEPYYFSDDNGQIFCAGIDSSTGTFEVLPYSEDSELTALFESWARANDAQERLPFKQWSFLKSEYRDSCFRLYLALRSEVSYNSYRSYTARVGRASAFTPALNH
ncbi:MAG: hypothetical protein NXI15_02805 [Gammaproteobacteria bacterium]|nr:hypothetical protein [Gammaproteobacteria bacterium]